MSATSARDRIKTLYDPELIEALGKRLMHLLGQHFATVENSAGNVLNWVPPEENIATARATLEHSPEPGTLPERFDEMVRLALRRGHNLHDPRYIGHQVPASVPLAGLFDALGSLTNQVMAIYEMGPWATSVERALVELWGDAIGLDRGTFAGVVTHGGSLANLTALLTARNIALGDVWTRGFTSSGPAPVLLAHADAHYSIARTAGILGLGTEQVIKVPLDDRRRMDVSALRTLLMQCRQSKIPVIAVVACACATPIGAFDPLVPIADLCEEFGVWMHVDAAHGGAVAFSEKHKELIAGLERADSFICDAHKTLFVPALCAFVFYRQREHRFEAFRQDAPYLFDPSSPGMAEYDSGMLTVECTKRAAAYGLWGLTALCGPGLFGDLIDTTFEQTRILYELLRAAPDFETLHEPQSNILVFRYHPELATPLSAEQVGDLNRQIRRELIESGEFYIVQTMFNGTGALRVCVMNPLTELQHLEDLLASIRRIGQNRISKDSAAVA